MSLADRLRAALVTPDDAAAPVAVAPAVQARRLFGAFWPFARPYKRPIAANLAVMAVIPALEAAGIWLFGVLVDDVLVARDLGALPLVLAAMAGVAVVGGALAFADDVLAASVGERFVLDLRVHLYDHLQRQGPHVLGSRRLGDLLARLTADVHAIESFVLAAVADGISAVLRLVFFCGALLLLDPTLAVAALVVIPAFWFVARTFGRLLKRAAREKRRRTGSLTAHAEERLAAAALVQTHCREDDEREGLAVEGRRIVAAELAATRVRALATPVVDLIELAGAAIVVALGTLALQDGDITIGGLMAFLGFLARMYSPARELGSLTQTLYAAAAGAERVLEVLSQPPAVVERADARELGRVRGELELDGVAVGYAGLEDVHMHVPGGESIALLGPSGAGKSTLARLLVRLEDPAAGTVRLDGHDLRDLTLRSVRDNVALLLQETMLFDAPLRDNIRYGRPEASDAEVRAALEAAAFGGRDLDLPVGQRGRALSGGEARRVALARTILRDAPVVVLDEPTTGLDERTRDALLPALARVMEGRTAVLITHDPVVAELADARLELGAVPA